MLFFHPLNYLPVSYYLHNVYNKSVNKYTFCLGQGLMDFDFCYISEAK